MDKLPGTSSGKNDKSCRIFHKKSNKIEFTFFWIFANFLRILQDSANHMHYLSYNFAVRPLNFLQFHNCALCLHKTP
jgi:hypothetical protein